MNKIGSYIYKTVMRSYPVGANGLIKHPPTIKFDMKNPYILDSLPDSVPIDSLVKYNGQDLKTVCNLLDGKTIRNGFTSKELDSLYRKAFPNIKVPTDVNCDAMVYLNLLPNEIGSKFDAHGLAKISVTQQLKDLNKLLTEGIDSSRNFYTAPLTVNSKDAAGVGAAMGTASGAAYRDGSFIIVGDKSKLLQDSGIKHVIVNDAYYNIIDDLQKKFQDVNFVRADNAVEYFSKL